MRSTDPIIIDCPTCLSVGAPSGTAPGTVAVTLAGSGLGADQLSGLGSFDSQWEEVTTGWTISGGVATCDGISSNASIGQPFGAVIGTTYRVTYDVLSSDSSGGDLFFSQWGFPGVGNTIPVADVSVGTGHTQDVLAQAAGNLRFNSNGWAGSIDNVTIKKVGGDNTITVRAFDSSNNQSSDSTVISYSAPPVEYPVSTMTSGAPSSTLTTSAPTQTIVNN